MFHFTSRIRSLQRMMHHNTKKSRSVESGAAGLVVVSWGRFIQKASLVLSDWWGAPRYLTSVGLFTPSGSLRSHVVISTVALRCKTQQQN